MFKRSMSFLSLVSRSSPRLSSVSYKSVTLIRNFSASTINLKKKAVKKEAGKSIIKDDLEEEAAVPEFNISIFEKRYKEALATFNKKSQELKQGKANAKIFDHLVISLDHKKESLLPEIALVTVKAGRGLVVTVYEPKNVKHIISAVIGMNLNMNPQIDPKNPQILNIALPPVTSATKKEMVKDLKHEFEHFKTSPSKHSLNGIREDAMKIIRQIKNSKGASKDDANKINKTFEVVHKKYMDELLANYKTLEKSLH
ncbi:ribosome recycling factor [Nadsonia fulvescens var. elongata DSM 6958]|uniref:Ribosome-recycling factor, mitochondrial n=1 Tax=Nadsonia fulvescens var. elongata DSM 6958 TaxID=857566 RepID=A0A1E3PKF2_9ASCO|nr:ribosome recycling factor [Nadsonia fulvescens var. elongata DSM 6958]